MNKTDDNILVSLFTDNSFRILRHLILLSVIGVVTVGFIWYVPVPNVPAYYKAYAWGVYFIMFTGIIYFNLYTLIPRLLFRNKYSAYVCWLMLFCVIVLLGIIAVQRFLLDIDVTSRVDIMSMAVNIASVIFIVGFLFLGTTALLLIKHHIISEIEKAELESSILESELKLLRNQVNPHFLFNMLNNVNMLLKKNPAQASDVLHKLEELLRYQIQDDFNGQVALRSEITFLNDYLNLERLRRDNFNYSIQQEGNLENIKLAPLLFIIFVENAVKHSADNDNLSYVKIAFKADKDKLVFTCKNSLPEESEKQDDVGGLGIANIKRRLELLYADKYRLNIEKQGLTYHVSLTISL